MILNPTPRVLVHPLIDWMHGAQMVAINMQVVQNFLSFSLIFIPLQSSKLL